MAEHALAQFGRIDGLINNAALKGLDKGRKKLWEIDPDDWDRLMAVNVRGVWLATRAVLPAMQAQGGGSIVNMASTVLLLGSTNFLHYACSKGAVLGFTRSAARELGEFNIRVNCILSGYIPTDSWQNPADSVNNAVRAQARIIQRAEVAEDLVGAAVFLASADSSYMSGQSINIDGGQTHL
jgi:3-oxoacyl-[acyl-carrier protein] reductase